MFRTVDYDLVRVLIVDSGGVITVAVVPTLWHLPYLPVPCVLWVVAIVVLVLRVVRVVQIIRWLLILVAPVSIVLACWLCVLILVLMILMMRSILTRRMLSISVWVPIVMPIVCRTLVLNG